MALGKLDSDYTNDWRQAFHFIRRPDQPDWLAFVHKSALIAGSVALGNRSVVGYKSHISLQTPLNIGNFTNIGGEFLLIHGGVHPMNYASQYGLNKALQMGLTRPDTAPPSQTVQHIGHDVWIAPRVTLFENVNVATGCVLGSNSVLTRNTEPYGVYVGNPARLLRFRFPEKHIADLLALAWWQWDVARIARNKTLFDTDLTTWHGNLNSLVVD